MFEKAGGGGYVFKLSTLLQEKLEKVEMYLAVHLNEFLKGISIF